MTCRGPTMTRRSLLCLAAVLAVLTAAIQTTTHTLPHVIVHLEEGFSEHPEDREKAADPELVRKAAGASLRLHQTAPVKFRIAAKDVT